MADDNPRIAGDQSREAIDALGGYVYQLYQSALAWCELQSDELLFLEVAEDYAVLAGEVLTAVQVKRTAGNVTINDEGVAKAIDSLVLLSKANPNSEVHVRFLTTSNIGVEKKLEDRVAGGAALKAWRSLAKSGDPSDLRAVLAKSGIAPATKKAIAQLSDGEFRSQFLRRIHFDCGEPSSEELRRDLSNSLGRVLKASHGRLAQLDAFEALVLRRLLEVSATGGDRVLSALEFQKLVEKVTHVSVRQEDFDRLLSQALGGGNSVVVSETNTLRTLPPLPPNRLARASFTANAQLVLEANGVLWLTAATGMGKTTVARMLADRSGGRWAGMSLRNFNEGQSASTLDFASTALAASGLAGLIVDDLDAVRTQDAQDALHQLITTADRLDLPLIFTASTTPPSKVTFSVGSASEISVAVPDFDKSEIAELIRAHGGDPETWTQYVYLGAGAGHPQLSEALIRNLRMRGWPIEELKGLVALLEGNSAVEEVRADCRRRLLRELDGASLALLERLSIQGGTFDRGLMLAVAATPPPIAQAGLLLDQLVGPWIDQIDSDHFQLSPLVTGLGQKTLDSRLQRQVQFAIADYLTRGQTLDASTMSTAALAALVSRNAPAMTKLTMAIVTASETDIALLSEHLLTFAYLKTDVPVWPEAGAVNMLIRGSQILLAKGRGDYSELPQIIHAFQTEIDQFSDDPAIHALESLIYVKLLADRSGATRAIPKFEQILARLSTLLPSTAKLLEDDGTVEAEFMRPGGVTVLGLAFFMQVQGLPKLDNLRETFAFISECDPQVRADILQPLSRTEFEPEMLVRGAWLAEHDAGSIRPDYHVKLLLDLEQESVAWGIPGIPIACRKFAAIIEDEYGQDKDAALVLLDEGLRRYGETNSELVRAKAKIYYRSGDHLGSLNLSRQLIDGNQIQSPVERAFLGRDAAVSAENQGDLSTARAYYLYARRAAQESSVPDMKPMAVGLGADAALAAWQSGDRATCLREFAVFFSELQTLDPKSSLRAAHCRAIGQHVLLWLDQEATGEPRTIEGGQTPQVYPGCVSNPEPHKDIGQRPVTPIEMGWYMLAKVECASGVNVGIADTIDQHLPDGPLIEGQSVLIPALLSRSLRNVDAKAFFAALQTQLALFAYMSAQGGVKTSFDVLNPTRGVVPPLVGRDAPAFESIAQLYVLAFLSACVFDQNITAFHSLLESLGEPEAPPNDASFLSAVNTGDGQAGFNGRLANLVVAAILAAQANTRITPTENWVLGLDVAQLTDSINEFRTLAPKAEAWMSRTWRTTLSEQRFLLVTPNLYEADIEEALAIEAGPIAKFLLLLKVTMGATRVANQPGALELVSSMQAKYLRAGD